MAPRPHFPSTSTTSTDMPARAAATASAAVTVVFPTPPLPATMRTREVEQKSATSITFMLGEVHAAAPARAARALRARPHLGLGVVRARADEHRRPDRRRAGHRPDRPRQRRTHSLVVARRRASALDRRRVPDGCVRGGRRRRRPAAGGVHPCVGARAGGGRALRGGGPGGGALLARSADVGAVANGAHLGSVDPVRYDDPSFKVSAPLKDVTTRSATLGDFIVSLDGRTVQTANGPVKLSTAKVVELNGRPTREARGGGHFHKLGVTGQVGPTPARAGGRR